MRLIDADELKKCAIPCEIHNGALTELCVPLYQIDNAPTVEIPVARWDCYCEGQKVGYEKALSERPQGEWIEHTERITFDTYYECSNCKEPWTTIEGTPWQNMMNFCPNCGADMRGKQ